MSALGARITVARGTFGLDVELDVADGEVLAVLGPNGAGKSTLLGALAGLHGAGHGRIVLGDRVLTDTAAGVAVPTHRRRIGLLSQQALLFPHLSARDNVAFGPRAAGASRAAARAAADRWLDAVDASALADRRPAQLSGGQAQRVAIGRALATEPDLLCLDEPFAGLDVDATPAIRSLLRRVVRASGVTTLLVTHDVLDALVLADRLVVLGDGLVVEAGPTAEVLARPRSAFTARIAGVNLVSGTACREGLRASDGSVLTGATPEVIDDGAAAVALFAPASVTVHLRRPPGDAFGVRLAAMEPHGELVRLRAGARPDGPAWADGLAADVGPATVAALDVEPGDELWFAPTDVAVHPAARPPV